MSIDYEMGINLRMFATATEAAIPIALTRGAEVVRGVAVGRAPDASGHLRGSAGVTENGFGGTANALVKFEGPYAAFQNRGMRADGTHVIRNRPAGGQTGFLTETMADQREAVLAIIADTIEQLA